MKNIAGLPQSFPPAEWSLKQKHKIITIEVFNIFHYICILPISTFAKWFLTKLVGVFMIDFGHDKQSSSCCFCLRSGVRIGLSQGSVRIQRS